MTTIQEIMDKVCKLEKAGGALGEIDSGWIGTCLRCGKRKMHVSEVRQTFHCFACGLGGHTEAAQRLVAAQTGLKDSITEENIAEYSETPTKLALDTWEKISEALYRYDQLFSANQTSDEYAALLGVIPRVMAGLIQGAMDKAVKDAEK